MRCLCCNSKYECGCQNYDQLVVDLKNAEDEVQSLRSALKFVLDWHTQNKENNERTGMKGCVLYPTLQHDIYIEVKQALKNRGIK